MTIVKLTGCKLTLSPTTDQNDHNNKLMMDHNSKQVHGPRFEPVTNDYNMHYDSKYLDADTFMGRYGLSASTS